MVKANVWLTTQVFSGVPKLEEFQCIEEEIQPCQDGDVVIEAEFLSVDPYQRYRLKSSNAPANTCPPASQVSRVIASKNPDFPEGCLILGNAGWRNRTHLTRKELTEVKVERPIPYKRLPDIGSLSPSAFLGALGMPGITATYGFLDICDPKVGDTVVVNSAAGAVGSLVCQIAKLKGCKVIAFAGSDEKVTWLKELGMDFVFNYKTVKVSQAIEEAAPNGVNCYFENVGGEFTSQVFPHMAYGGRISICGVISKYTEDSNYSTPDYSTSKSPFVDLTILSKALKIQGFHAFRWYEKWWIDEKGFTQMKNWVEEGKIKYRETLTDGFKNMPQAFLGLFKGENIGKAVVKA